MKKEYQHAAGGVHGDAYFKKNPFALRGALRTDCLPVGSYDFANHGFFVSPMLFPGR
jgi:hypothetical protein